MNRALLLARAELTDAVCRELASSTGEDFFDCDAPEKLRHLRRWLEDHDGGDVSQYDVGLPVGDDDNLVVRLRAGSRACDALAMLLTADTPSEIRSDAAGIRRALGEWERLALGVEASESPAYAIHAPVRTMLVIPGGEPRHRSSFDLPGLRVHAVSAETPRRFTELAEELHRRGLTFFSGFDPRNVAVETAFVNGLDDNGARELGRRYGKPAVARWDASAWTDLNAEGGGGVARGWRYELFDWDAHDLDAIEIVRRPKVPIVSSWTITGTPGAWTVHARPGMGRRTTRSDAERIVDVVAADPELHMLHRGTISRFAVHGNVDPDELVDVLSSDAREGTEAPEDWPADYDDTPGQWRLPEGQEYADSLPWVDRWASVNGRRLSTLWADGRSLVVFRDAPREILRRRVDAMREEAWRRRSSPDRRPPEERPPRSADCASEDVSSATTRPDPS